MSKLKTLANELGFHIKYEDDGTMSVYRGTVKWSMYGPFSEDDMEVFLESYKTTINKKYAVDDMIWMT